MAPKKENGLKGVLENEVVSPWESWEIERKQKQARGAQRKELVNGIGSKANKPNGKWCGNRAIDAQKTLQNLVGM